LLSMTFLSYFLSLASRGSRMQGDYSIVKLKSTCKQSLLSLYYVIDNFKNYDIFSTYTVASHLSTRLEPGKIARTLPVGAHFRV
jgi:hypothetical protein